MQKHIIELSKLYTDTVSMCTEASECIPAICPKLNSDSAGGTRNVPGWSKEFEHLKQLALFWYRQWRSVGKQHQGDITEISIEVVIVGVQRLKLDTSDDKEDLNNYHIKYGPRII